jgi:hypothetical protein
MRSLSALLLISPGRTCSQSSVPAALLLGLHVHVRPAWFVRDNLTARISEAQREGWTGEAEGLQVSLAAANSKLAQADSIITRRHDTASLGMPSFPDVAGRTAAPAKTSQELKCQAASEDSR